MEASSLMPSAPELRPWPSSSEIPTKKYHGLPLLGKALFLEQAKLIRNILLELLISGIGRVALQKLLNGMARFFEKLPALFHSSQGQAAHEHQLLQFIVLRLAPLKKKPALLSEPCCQASPLVQRIRHPWRPGSFAPLPVPAASISASGG